MDKIYTVNLLLFKIIYCNQYFNIEKQSIQ